MSDDIVSKLQIEKRTTVPIYQQLQQQLEKLILEGTWKLKEPLPSETMLAESLNISVMTVRQAMAKLVNKGLIYREKGRGTFVVPQPLEHHLQRLESFSEDMRARAMNPSSKTLVFEVVPVPLRIAPRLRIKTGAEVLHLRRLRLVDDRPVALHNAYVNYTGLDRDTLDRFGSLYDALEHAGIQLVEADETLQAVAANADIARLLAIDVGAPLLQATRVTWDQAHVPVEHVVAHYRADFYRYTVRLRR